MKFTDYLNEIEALRREKKHDEAWMLANKGLSDLLRQDDEQWYMMYYQLALIVAKEEKWKNVLEQMGFMLYFLQQLHPAHMKLVKRALDKLDKLDRFNEYVNLASSTPPVEQDKKLAKLLA